jgi:hypothetical protein
MVTIDPRTTRLFIDPAVFEPIATAGAAGDGAGRDGKASAWWGATAESLTGTMNSGDAEIGAEVG